MGLRQSILNIQFKLSLTFMSNLDYKYNGFYCIVMYNERKLLDL